MSNAVGRLMCLRDFTGALLSEPACVPILGYMQSIYSPQPIPAPDQRAYDEVAEVERQRRERELVQRTLDHDQMVMFFQPLVDADSQPIGVEALARLKTSTGDIVTPAGFIDAIDGTSLMVKLDGRAFEMSCRAAKILGQRFPGRHMYVSCNFSATTLREPNLAENVLTTICNQKLRPDRLCIEVTETAMSEAGTEQLEAIRAAGVRVALDNFGTGCTQIAGLKDLPLTSVKIDRSFTAALDKSGTERAIATMVVELAQSLGLDVVAEGVENSRQWRTARDLGIEKMQGWFYAPALPFDELLAKITPTAPLSSTEADEPVGVVSF